MGSVADPAALRTLVDSTPGLSEILCRVLDRREQGGRLPRSVTVDAPSACHAPLRALLSARAVRPLEGGRVRLDLELADRALREQDAGPLEVLLYQALGRTPRDPKREEAERRAALDTALAELASECRTDASRAFLEAERALAPAECDPAEAMTEARRLILCIDAVLVNGSPIRLPNFAARALADSKGLTWGSDRWRRLCDALLQHDPFTAAEVEYVGDQPPPGVARRLALEVHEVFRDESAISVLCFGPLVYEKQGQRFDSVARHAALGDPVRLTLKQLRDARLVDLAAERVTLVENQTPFLDYIEVLASHGNPPNELVILSEGQANSAVVALLKLVRRRGLPVRHSGDLDRSGVLILRSLQHRSGIPITALLMDAATHARYLGCGRPIDDRERERLDAVLAADGPDAVAHELLVAIRRTGKWIEQEHFTADLLSDLGPTK
jgi:hypothetical protein